MKLGKFRVGDRVWEVKAGCEPIQTEVFNIYDDLVSNEYKIHAGDYSYTKDGIWLKSSPNIRRLLTEEEMKKYLAAQDRDVDVPKLENKTDETPEKILRQVNLEIKAPYDGFGAAYKYDTLAECIETESQYKVILSKDPRGSWVSMENPLLMMITTDKDLGLVVNGFNSESPDLSSMNYLYIAMKLLKKFDRSAFTQYEATVITKEKKFKI